MSCHPKGIEEKLKEIQSYLEVKKIQKIAHQNMFGKTNNTIVEPYLCHVCNETFTDLDSFISRTEGSEKDDFFVCNKWKSLFTAGNELNDQYDDDECHLQRSSSVPETYANQRIPNCGNFQQSDVEIEKQRTKPSSSNKEDCTNTSYLCDERDGSFTPELSPPLRKIVHNYMEYTRDNCNEAFLTTRESEKYPCEILQTDYNANEKPTLVSHANPSSNIGPQLGTNIGLTGEEDSRPLGEAPDTHLKNSEPTRTDGAHCKSDTTPQSRIRAKSIESPENVSYSAEVVLPKPRKVDVVSHEPGNIMVFNRNYIVTASNQKSRFTKSIKSHQCKKIFQQKLTLAVHMMKHKYSICRSKKYDQKCGVSLCFKNRLNPGRIYQQLTWSGLAKQQRNKNRKIGNVFLLSIHKIIFLTLRNFI